MTDRFISKMLIAVMAIAAAVLLPSHFIPAFAGNAADQSNPPVCHYNGDSGRTITTCPAGTPPGCYEFNYASYLGRGLSSWPTAYNPLDWFSCPAESNLGVAWPEPQYRSPPRHALEPNAPCPNDGPPPGKGIWTSTGVTANAPTRKSENCNPVDDARTPPASVIDPRTYCSQHPAGCRPPKGYLPAFCVSHPDQCSPNSVNPHPENPASLSQDR